MIHWSRVLAVTASFALIGPVVSGIVALGWTLATLDRHHPAVALAIVLVWTAPLLVGMVTSAPAAVASGVVLGLASCRIRGGSVWVGVATVATAIMASVSRLIFQHQTDPVATGLAGAAAGLVCGVTTLVFRPRPAG